MSKSLDHSKPKTCKSCNEFKPIAEFRIVSKAYIKGFPVRSAKCIVCTRLNERLKPHEIVYKNCTQCDKQFPQHGRKATCSKDCYRSSRRKTKINYDNNRWKTILSNNNLPQEVKGRLIEEEKLRTLAKREISLRYKYGISVEQYLVMFNSQGSVCAICKKSETALDSYTGEVKNLAVDHNHETGKVRGLLCSACNRGLGYFKENIEALYSGIEYLLHYRDRNE
jgi:hypothetical protein